MIRGTTPTLVFHTPYKGDMVASGFITFTQRGDILLDIPISDSSVEVSNNAIALTLTQAQTLMFDPQGKNLVQIRLVLEDGSVVASNIVTISVGKILKDGEI